MRTIQWNSRIEESQFPNLNYEEWPMFSVPSGTHHSMIKGGTLSVGNHPVIVLGQGVEFKLMKRARYRQHVALYATCGVRER